MPTWMLISLGGAVGTAARYGLSLWLPQVAGTRFPWATLSVNLLGSFLLAIIMFAGLRAGILSPTWRMTLGTGVMGGFTTYSTFSYETLSYLQAGNWRLGLANTAATLVGCLAAAAGGHALARSIWA